VYAHADSFWWNARGLAGHGLGFGLGTIGLLALSRQFGARSKFFSEILLTKKIK
jgi:hypothetical protein